MIDGNAASISHAIETTPVVQSLSDVHTSTPTTQIVTASMSIADIQQLDASKHLMRLGEFDKAIMEQQLSSNTLRTHVQSKEHQLESELNAAMSELNATYKTKREQLHKKYSPKIAVSPCKPEGLST
jgi:hypothetical protein